MADEICGVTLHGQHPADSKGPDFQDPRGWRQCQLQFGLLSPPANTLYTTVDITEGKMKLKFDQVRVSVQSELLVKQCSLIHDWEVVYKMLLFFAILCKTSSEYATVLPLKHYGKSPIIS